jgi:hypothetical protein
MPIKRRDTFTFDIYVNVILYTAVPHQPQFLSSQRISNIRIFLFVLSIASHGVLSYVSSVFICVLVKTNGFPRQEIHIVAAMFLMASKNSFTNSKFALLPVYFR